MDNKKTPAEELAGFLKEAFVINQEKQATAEKTRILTRWYFELVRNIIVIASLEFLAKKSGSVALSVFAYASTVVLFVHLHSYSDPIVLVPKRWVQNKWVYNGVFFLLNLAFLLPWFYGINIYLPKLIGILVDGYLAQPK